MLLHIVAGAFSRRSLIGRGGYPRAVRLAWNTQHARSGDWRVCVGFNHTLAVLGAPVALPPPHGFTAIGTVLADFSTGADLSNCHLAADPHVSNRLVATYRHHTGCVAKKGCTRYALEASESTDGGRSWSYLATIVHGTVGMWEPFGTYELAACGAHHARRNSDAPRPLTVAYSQELTNGGQQSIVAQSSVDGGRSWSAPRTLSDGRAHNSRDGMPGLATLASGDVVLVFEGFWANGWGHFSVQGRLSKDGGCTFDEGRVLFAPPNTTGSAQVPIRNAGAPQVVAFAGGNRLFVSFMSDEASCSAAHENDDTNELGVAGWPNNACVEVMASASAAKSGALDFDVASRHVYSPLQAKWPALALTWPTGGEEPVGGVLLVYGLSDGESYVEGPLDPALYTR